MRVSENVPLSSLTTMRLGGPARYVVEVEQPIETPDAYNFAKLYSLPTAILGGGANSIGRDEGFPGAIIMNKIRGIELKPSAENPEIFELKAMGGEIWDDVVAFACENGLTGIEALSKIPGTAGAAPVQNIGAYGQDISQVLKSIEAYDTTDGHFKLLTNKDLKFGYRKSILNTTMKGRFFVISMTMTLKKGQMARPFYNSLENFIKENGETDFSPSSIRRMVSAIRADKLPDPAKIPSAGSFFKNVYIPDSQVDECRSRGLPVYQGADGNKINSGWLIEKAGLAGKTIHGFHVNEKAALVLINECATGYEDLIEARNEIANKVYDRFGFKLEQEPVEIV